MHYEKKPIHHENKSKHYEKRPTRYEKRPTILCRNVPHPVNDCRHRDFRRSEYRCLGNMKRNQYTMKRDLYIMERDMYIMKIFVDEVYSTRLQIKRTLLWVYTFLLHIHRAVWRTCTSSCI